MNYQDASTHALTDDTTSVATSTHTHTHTPCLFLKKFYQFLAAFSSQNRQIDKIKIIKVPLMLI